MKTSIEFFDTQFRRQNRQDSVKLNLFEEAALPYLRGEVLDFGCGMGNQAFAAAAQGCNVTALAMAVRMLWITSVLAWLWSRASPAHRRTVGPEK